MCKLPSADTFYSLTDHSSKMVRLLQSVYRSALKEIRPSYLLIVFLARTYLQFYTLLQFLFNINKRKNIYFIYTDEQTLLLRTFMFSSINALIDFSLRCMYLFSLIRELFYENKYITLTIIKTIKYSVPDFINFLLK